MHIEVPVSELEVYDTFGAWDQNDHDNVIWCCIENIEGDELHVSVINGAWNLRFDRRTGLCIPLHIGRRYVIEGIEIFFTGRLPIFMDGRRWDYNAAIQYMIEHADDPVEPRSDSEDDEPETDFVDVEIPF